MECLKINSLARVLKQKGFCFLFSVVLIMPFSAWADEDAEALIEAMVDSINTSDYKGYFTFERGRQSRSFFVAHKLVDGEERQRLVFMDGQPLEVLGQGQAMHCEPSVDLQSHNGLSGHADGLSRSKKNQHNIWDYYTAEMDHQKRVAGRHTQRVILNPRDEHRYPYVFDIDKESNMLVQMLMLDLNGQPLERLHFVQLDIDTVTEADLKPASEAYRTFEPVATASVANEKEVWRLNWKPSGFQQECAVLKPWGERRYDQALMFSDGLTAFSVFVEQSTSDYHRELAFRVGGTSAVSFILNDQSQQYLITVVGEVPLQTAKQIALGLNLQP